MAPTRGRSRARAAARRLRRQRAAARLADERAGLDAALAVGLSGRRRAGRGARVRPGARRARAHRPRRPAGARRTDALRRRRSRAWCSNPAAASSRCAAMRRRAERAYADYLAGAAAAAARRAARRAASRARAPRARPVPRRCDGIADPLSRLVAAGVLCEGRPRGAVGDRVGGRHRVGAGLAPAAAGMAEAATARAPKRPARATRPSACAGASHWCWTRRARRGPEPAQPTIRRYARPASATSCSPTPTAL